MEQEHLYLHKKVNSWKEQGVELHCRLREELVNWKPASSGLADQLGKICNSFTKNQKVLHRDFIKSSLYYQVVQEAPFYWQIMNKPFGYPGDAELMLMAYRNQFEGKTPFGRLIHLQAVETEACQAVRHRKEFLYNHIIDTIRQHHGEGVRILSLAAGPAQEIQEVLRHQSEKGISFLALDHDMRTISNTGQSFKDKRFRYALANAFQIMEGLHTIAYPRQPFHRYCNPKRDMNGWGKIFGLLFYEVDQLQKNSFDLVYSAGLYDYIRTHSHNDQKGAVALTKQLYNFVKPGGSLVIGNFSPNNPRYLRFMMEFVFDWILIYRNKQEMMDFARSIPEGDIRNITVLEEPLGINYFLKIDKV